MTRENEFLRDFYEVFRRHDIFPVRDFTFDEALDIVIDFGVVNDNYWSHEYE